MKKLFNILLVLVLALSLALPALAEEAEAPAPQIVDAKVITYTTDEARTTAAVRIEYDQPITTGTYGLSDYFVNGYDVRVYKLWLDKDGNEIKRVVDHVDAYPTRRAEITVGGAQPAPTPAPAPAPVEGTGE